MRRLLAITLFFSACHAPRTEGDAICRDSNAIMQQQGMENQGSGAHGMNRKRIMTQQGMQLHGTVLGGHGTNLRRILVNNSFGELQLRALTLQGTTITGVTEVGELVPVDLLGAKLPARTVSGDLVELEFTDVVVEGEVTYYTLTFPDGTDLCASGRGVFEPGVRDELGMLHNSMGEGDELRDVTFSCAESALCAD